jgi:excisionase family DNA binding protein
LKTLKKGILIMKFLTSSEVAKILDVTPDAVRAIERRGELPAIRIGKGQRLFTKTAVDRLLVERNKQLQRRSEDGKSPV